MSMERIQRVLQQSKESPGGEGGRTASPGSALSTIPVPLIYTHTRTVVPSVSAMREHRVVMTANGGPYLEAYKILRTQIVHRLHEHRWNVIGVTSPGQGEGKTSVAANLAICLAMDPNFTALLIDANLRNPQVHQLFGIENRGLADFLLDQASLVDLLIHPQIDRLVVLPGGGPLQHSVEALTLPKMKALVEEVRTRYTSRVVVVDLPPLLHMADVLAIAPMLDAVLLVVEAGRTTEDDISRALSLIQGNLPVLGTVLNKATSGV